MLIWQKLVSHCCALIVHFQWELIYLVWGACFWSSKYNNSSIPYISNQTLKIARIMTKGQHSVNELLIAYSQT